jgi:hypothetical protein
MRSLWALVGNTMAQALRLKIAVVFSILLLVLLPVMSLVMVGDGTIKGRLQSFISYGLSLTSLLLCVLTIIVSTYTVSSDIQQKQVYTVLTKPVRRYQYLCGKFLGVVLLDVVLLAAFSGLIYGLTSAIPSLLGTDAQQMQELRNEFFCARASLVPTLDEKEIAREVARQYRNLREAGELPAEMDENQVIAELTHQRELARRSAAPASQITWEFTGVKPPQPDQPFFVRYKYEVSVEPLDLNILGRWYVGDIRQYQYGYEMKTPIYVLERRDIIRTFHEISVPANALASDGYLAVMFENPVQNNTVVMFPQGVEFLYKADSFTFNFIRATLVIFARLIFLAALGVSACTWLSFPVAVMVCCVVYFAASISGFFLESIEFLSKSWGLLYSLTIRPVIKLLPEFDKYNPINNIVSARLLSWAVLGWVFAVMVGVKAVVLWLLGMVIFAYREIAKIAV